ncbi:tRNA (N6-threonylcarbamoyladenosine(37)-N6)-methyltransferase TrmO [Saliniradius amylolyticus]|nr:tRNA (N6-threonylcarbamoyladenosine(37)-N6)-methyltransferase TrmO [Saliniradius amylolyticus]
MTTNTDAIMQIEPIGTIQTPYDEKFAVPRQPGLADTPATIRFSGDYNQMDCFRGIEQFSHLWLIFQFHQAVERGWKPLVRPPRLGGNDKLGVFATRSSHRPNGLGMSVVALQALESVDGKPMLKVCGTDLVNGTPIIDIKPYIPYADAIDNAHGGFAHTPPATELAVNYTPEAQQQLSQHSEEFRRLVHQVLAQDPRPAYQKQASSARIYGVSLQGMNVRWQVVDGQVLVLDLNDRREISS